MTLERTNEYVSCLRKRRHIDYLSALRHATTLDRNYAVVVYPCDYCAGLHVGHQALMIKRRLRRKGTSAPQNPLLRDIARTKRKIELRIKHFERGVTNPRPVTVKKYQQSLTDLREHLVLLESRLSVGLHQQTDNGSKWRGLPQRELDIKEKTMTKTLKKTA